MKLHPTDLPGVVIVEPTAFADDRGWFMESWNERGFADGLQALGLPAPRAFVQDNHSCSHAGVLRGLHYQLPPHAQGKLVRVVKGAAFDVAVDIRRSSPTSGVGWVSS
jgi:dTDP-4-dehydrorhamnose 3,5-epimerase